jgi:hypothetical protein
MPVSPSLGPSEHVSSDGAEESYGWGDLLRIETSNYEENCPDYDERQSKTA